MYQEVAGLTEVVQAFVEVPVHYSSSSWHIQQSK